MASLLSIISLNTNKRADLGGLHSIIRDCQPQLVFLQEVKSTQILTSLASAYNYQVFASTLIQPQRPRICAILSRLPATTVLEILPGKAQMASIGAPPLSTSTPQLTTERPERPCSPASELTCLYLSPPFS